MSHLFSTSPRVSSSRRRRPEEGKDSEGSPLRQPDMDDGADSDVEMMESELRKRSLAEAKSPLSGSAVLSAKKGTTPRPVRHDIASRRRLVKVRPFDADAEAESSVEPSSSLPPREDGPVIWGTNFTEESIAKRIRSFFKSGEYGAHYSAVVADQLAMAEEALALDMRHVLEYDSELYDQMRMFPQECIGICDAVLVEVFDLDSDGVWLSTRPFALRDVKSMRDMNPTEIDTLVAVRGMVIRSTSLIPDINMAFFRCTMCNEAYEGEIECGRIEEPRRCPNASCQGQSSMELVHNRCRFLDKQLVKIQEAPEHIPDGDTPQTMDVYVYADLVDSVRCGDRVEVTAVYRAAAVRRNPRMRTLDSVYKTFLDTVQIDVIKGAVDVDGDDMDMALQREEKYEAIARDPHVYDTLTRSLAPSIFEMEDVKRGLLCQLFGGTNASCKTRSEVNVLLCGDPGTSKSQLLCYVHRMAPRGIYTSGKGSSAVGLTAYISKDRDSGELVLESGALVLSDLGICCIDEFDKMTESSRSILHEVMEQQTVSIAKAGIIATLNARTSILAAANPIESRYNPRKSVVENIDLPPTLMSRFDLIYLILDTPNQKLDAKLARHIVSMYYADCDRQAKARVEAEATLSQEDLQGYVKYARRVCHPKLRSDSAAASLLIESYVEMRQLGRTGRSRCKVVSATPRQLEALIRLSQALARLHLSEEVTTDHVSEAVRLHKVATLAAATDPNTGAIDLDRLNIGMSMADERRLQTQCDAMLAVLGTASGNRITVKSVLKKFNSAAVSEEHSGSKPVAAVGMAELKQIMDRLVKLEKVRPCDWLRDNPVILIIDTNQS